MEWFECNTLPTIGVVKKEAFTFMDISGIGVEAPRDNDGLLVYLYRKYNNTRVRLYFFDRDKGIEIYNLLEKTFRDPEHNLVVIPKEYAITFSMATIKSAN